VSSLCFLATTQYLAHIGSIPTSSPSIINSNFYNVYNRLHGRGRVGVASTYLADYVKKGDHVNIYVNNNPDFRLPQHTTGPIVMIGPGTGIGNRF